MFTRSHARVAILRHAAWSASAWVAWLAIATGAALAEPRLSVRGGALEVWLGGDATRHAWSAWSGATWSPFGTLSQDGWRVRISGGGGLYDNGDPSTRYGTSGFADLLVGFQMGVGTATLKLFGGATHGGNAAVLALPVDEQVWGGKVVGEAWINLTPTLWGQTDLSYATANDSYSARVRLGHRLTQAVSIGVEARTFGDDGSDGTRAGGFARYEWRSGEISLAAGLSRDGLTERTPYATLVFLQKF